MLQRHILTTGYETMTLEAARAKAQRLADATGLDYGIIGSEEYGWTVRGLPSKHLRTGRERTCEYAMASDYRICFPGHGPCATSSYA